MDTVIVHNIAFLKLVITDVYIYQPCECINLIFVDHNGQNLNLPN
jgi:hypothetical protein